jgi:hypothetical protein
MTKGKGRFFGRLAGLVRCPQVFWKRHTHGGVYVIPEWMAAR